MITHIEGADLYDDVVLRTVYDRGYELHDGPYVHRLPTGHKRERTSSKAKDRKTITRQMEA